MATTLHAIEVTGTINERRELQLDEPLPVTGPSRVRVIILVPQDVDGDEREWLRVAAAGQGFDFLDDPAEDIYSPSDGKPFHDEG